MAEERVHFVNNVEYDYSASNPCRCLQDAFKGFLRCLGLGDVSGSPPPANPYGPLPPSDGPPPTMDPIDEIFPPPERPGGRRAPSRGPISSGGPGQTN